VGKVASGMNPSGSLAGIAVHNVRDAFFKQLQSPSMYQIMLYPEKNIGTLKGRIDV